MRHKIFSVSYLAKNETQTDLRLTCETQEVRLKTPIHLIHKDVNFVPVLFSARTV